MNDNFESESRQHPLRQSELRPPEPRTPDQLENNVVTHIYEQDHPVLSTIKRIGGMVIDGLAKSGSTLGIRPPRER